MLQKCQETENDTQSGACRPAACLINKLISICSSGQMLCSFAYTKSQSEHYTAFNACHKSLEICWWKWWRWKHFNYFISDNYTDNATTSTSSILHGGGPNCPEEIYGNGKEIKITNMLTNGSTSSHTSARRHVIIIFPHNLISFDMKWDLQTCKNKMPVAQWAWKRAILLAPFYTSLSSCVLVYSSLWQERCGTANRRRRRWTFRKCQGWTLTQQQIEGWCGNTWEGRHSGHINNLIIYGNK